MNFRLLFSFAMALWLVFDSGSAAAQADLPVQCIPALPSSTSLEEFRKKVPELGRVPGLGYNDIVVADQGILIEDYKRAMMHRDQRVQALAQARIAELEALDFRMDARGRRPILTFPPSPFTDGYRDCASGFVVAASEDEKLLYYASDHLRVVGDLCAAAPSIVYVDHPRSGNLQILEQIYSGAFDPEPYSDKSDPAPGYPYDAPGFRDDGFYLLMRQLIGVRIFQCGTLPRTMAMNFVEITPGPRLNPDIPNPFRTLLEVQVQMSEDRFAVVVRNDDVARGYVARTNALRDKVAREFSKDQGEFAIGVLLIAAAMAILGSDPCRNADVPGTEVPLHCTD